MKDVLHIDGKIFISSSRAAEMAKYSNDYVGQLCRSGKVLARMVGRSWYVEQDSLVAHKKTSDSAFEVRKKNHVPYQPVIVSAPVAAPAPAVTAFTQPAARPVVSPLSYSADARPLIPTLSKGRTVAAVTATAPVTASEVSRTFAAVSHERVASTSRVALALSIVGVVVIAGAWIAIGDVPGGSSSSGQAASVGSAIDRAIAFVADLFMRNPRQVARQPGASAEESLPWNGVVVAPSLAEDDRATEERIRDSFSDEVEIKPDQSGTAGVITPVFKESKGDDYVYVLVPVNKESGKDGTEHSP